MKKTGCIVGVLVALFDLLLISVGIQMVVAPEKPGERSSGAIWLALLATVHLVLFLIGRAIMKWGEKHPETPDQKEARERNEVERNARKRQRRIAAEERKYAAQQARRTTKRSGGRMVSGEWVPPTPSGRVDDQVAGGDEEVEVVGESYHDAELLAVLAKATTITSSGTFVSDEPATLVLDPKNPYSNSKCAIAVYIDGKHAGYIPDAITANWHERMTDLAVRGLDLRVRALTRGRPDRTNVRASVTVWMPPTDRAVHAQSRIASASSSFAPSSSLPTSTPAPSARATPPAKRTGGEWIPEAPHGELLDPWGRCEERVEVAGLMHHRAPLTKALRGDPEFRVYGGGGARLKEPVVLTSDGGNPYSDNGNAVAVFLRGEHIGYLPQHETPTWGPIMRELHSEGFDLRVPANIWGHDAEHGEHYSVWIQLPEPSQLTPSNGLPPEPHVVIPAGRKRQVTKEEQHIDVLAPLVVPDGTNHVAAVLRAITEMRARSSYEAVQVELDGHRVGILSDVQSKNLLPLVKYIEARGKLPMCRADIVGTAIKAEVILYCADAGEVGSAWLDDLGPEIPKPTEVIPGPDWDWDDEPVPAVRAATSAEGTRGTTGQAQG